MVIIWRMGKWALRQIHIPTWLVILVVASATLSLKWTLGRQKPHSFVIPLCSNNINPIPMLSLPLSFLPHHFINVIISSVSAEFQFTCTMNHPKWWNMLSCYPLLFGTFEIFSILFPLAHRRTWPPCVCYFQSLGCCGISSLSCNTTDVACPNLIFQKLNFCTATSPTIWNPNSKLAIEHHGTMRIPY